MHSKKLIEGEIEKRNKIIYCCADKVRLSFPFSQRKGMVMTMKKYRKHFIKFTSLILAFLILFSALSISTFAVTADEFDINDLTWEELMSMNAEEFHQLLVDFERVYIHLEHTKPIQ